MEWKETYSGKLKKIFKSPIGGANKFIERELIDEDLNYRMNDDDEYYSDTFYETRYIKFPDYDLDLDIYPHGRFECTVVLGIITKDNEIFVRRLKGIIEMAFEYLYKIDSPG